MYYLPADEVQEELDQIQVKVNDKVLPPGETLELEAGDAVIEVVFTGTTAPDLLSDIIVRLAVSSGEVYTSGCYDTRSCHQTVRGH
jgi:hypothetical protein